MGKSVYFSNLIPYTETMLHASIKTELPLTHSKVSYGYRIFVVIHGSCELVIDGNEQLCQTGDAVFLCPHQEYSTVFHPPGCTTINLAFSFSDRPQDTDKPPVPPERIIRFTDKEESPERYSEKLDFIDLPVFNSSFMICDIPDAVERFQEMYRLFASDDLFAHMRLSSQSLRFIADVAEYATAMKSQIKNDLAHRVLDYIDAHCGERLTCAQIAEEFSYHPSYINRIVRNYTGFSLHDYITRRKIRKASAMLRKTDLSITEIAQRLSFYDSSHFCKVFQMHTGLSPSDARKRHDEQQLIERRMPKQDNIRSTEE